MSEYAPFNSGLDEDDPGVLVRLPSGMVNAMRVEVATQGSYKFPRSARILHLIDTQGEAA